VGLPSPTRSNNLAAAAGPTCDSNYECYSLFLPRGKGASAEKLHVKELAKVFSDPSLCSSPRSEPLNPHWYVTLFNSNSWHPAQAMDVASAENICRALNALVSILKVSSREMIYGGSE
jgi:hypothetical protein